MPSSTDLAPRAAAHLRALCVDIDNRRVASPGNRAATAYYAREAAALGLRVSCRTFEGLDWREHDARLVAGGEAFPVHASRFSPSCEVRAPLVAAGTIEELEAADLRGRVVLLHGAAAAEQVMPKGFFYFPDHHRRIVEALAAGEPAAVVAASQPGGGDVGAGYPYPLFEDGDFAVPSLYLSAEDGERLLAHVGSEVEVRIVAERLPSAGEQCVARAGARRDRRVVLFAHIDTRPDTPGATDNAGGVAALLVLGELLAGYEGDLGVEIVAMNGEDYYGASGERLFLEENEGRMGEIVLGVNIDGIAYREAEDAYSLYNCPDDLAASVRAACAPYAGLVEGDPWYAGDHGLFLMSGVPAVAFTSAGVGALLAEYTHTPRDTVELVDPRRVVTVARALRDLIERLAATSGA